MPGLSFCSLFLLVLVLDYRYISFQINYLQVPLTPASPYGILYYLYRLHYTVLQQPMISYIVGAAPSMLKVLEHSAQYTKGIAATYDILHCGHSAQYTVQKVLQLSMSMISYIVGIAHTILY